MINSIFEMEKVKPNDTIRIRLRALRLPHISLTLIACPSTIDYQPCLALFQVSRFGLTR